jgi:hypothetical protein
MTRTIGRVLIFLIALTFPAHAGWHGHEEWGGNAWNGGHQWHQWGGGYSEPFGGAMGGFAGGVVGSLLGGLFARPAPPQVVVVPSVPEIVPGSPAWYQYCSSKYRSWNGSTYLGYDGLRHPCS